jgi:hypothetical protein
MGEDFLCGHTPQGGAVIEPLISTSGSLVWAADAQERLDRIPAFVRRMVRGKIETAVRKSGGQVVTVDDMTKMAKAKFGAKFDKMAFKRPDMERRP